MRIKFDEQLEILNSELIKMGALCESVIAAAINALLKGEESERQKVFATDEEIDQKERDIESMCLRLLLQQQPVAKDLRAVSAALKMISDMERIGDQASDIAEIVKSMRGGKVKNNVTHINEMATATMKMVTNSIESFVRKDLELANGVIRADDIVDSLFDRVRGELIELICEDSANGELCIDYLMIAKYFERIGDHAVNIAEWVIYSITGEH